MTGTVRPKHERDEAVALYAEHGLAFAHHQTAVPKTTLQRWAREAGLDTTTIGDAHARRTLAATAARAVRCDAMRIELREQLLEIAGSLLNRIDQPHMEFKGNKADVVEYAQAPPSACRDYVWAAAVLIDKYRLEVGEATDRSEIVADRSVEVEERLAKIVDLASERRAS